MWVKGILILKKKVNGLRSRRNSYITTIFFTIVIFVLIAAMLTVFTGQFQGYSPVANKCISCHNDTGYPVDTNLDGVAAPYKRPHNDTVMCESCHLTNPHNVVFVQPDGNYGTRLSAASCPECHQGTVPNANFTRAPIISNPLRHSSNILNGSSWGNYWTNASPKTACLYCHGITLHNISPIGRMLDWSPDYKMYGDIGANFTCSGCHYKGDANWSQMNLTFASAGLPTPPEITNGTNWNGTSHKYYNHSLDVYDDQKCKLCHGMLLSANANMSEFLHNVAEGAGGEECLACHTSDQGIYPAINITNFARHNNVNSTDGVNTLSNGDCMVCHYNFNFTEMMLSGFTTPTKICTECHIEGNFSAPIIKNHRPPRLPARSPGANISTTAYCSTCHNNSINQFAYSVNASAGHYGTNASLIKPTVNQTAMPRFGFMNQTDASTYNKDCNNCHNPSNPNYGNATLITVPHTGSATCNKCHVNGNASNLHNGTLAMPQTFSCLDCHTTYASRYSASNLTGTNMLIYLATACEACHGGGNLDGLLGSLSEHNINRNFIGQPGNTDTVYLNGQATLSVIKGTAVTVTSRVNDIAGEASRVGGAEYYIDTDPGVGKGIPMEASDGLYNAANQAWENVTAIVDTTNLSGGSHTIFVRGVDIGKQWSQTKNATLTVQSLGYINGTVTSLGISVPGAYVSTTGASDTTQLNGNYSLIVPIGTYTVNASKQPEYYDNSTTGVVVTPLNTTILYIVVTGKPTGTLSGVVRNV